MWLAEGNVEKYKILKMVFVLDCKWKTQCASVKRKRSFLKKKIQCLTLLDVTKCFKQIKYRSLLLTCAPFNELLFDISIPLVKQWNKILERPLNCYLTELSFDSFLNICFIIYICTPIQIYLYYLSTLNTYIYRVSIQEVLTYFIY